MAVRRNEISKELEDQLRAVSFSSPKESADTNDLEVHSTETALTVEEDVIATTPEPLPKKVFSLDKRMVTLEYLDKLEQATIASARYESIRDFSQLVSNLSIVLLSLSIITYLIFYFVNPHSISLLSLLMLSLEAVTLFGLMLYSTLKTSTYKQIRDMRASDFSTCSQAIGNPRVEAYKPIEMPEIPS